MSLLFSNRRIDELRHVVLGVLLVVWVLSATLVQVNRDRFEHVVVWRVVHCHEFLTPSVEVVELAREECGPSAFGLLKFQRPLAFSVAGGLVNQYDCRNKLLLSVDATAAEHRNGVVDERHSAFKVEAIHLVFSLIC